ncbi:twin-arginine translocation signal domain-containing protein [Halorarius litoreus]|uniref:twin-arginine translocation signal domain-containing protein n=1 Tax=Halorarius litoreus TaxID=2962676 RepID=UPI0020CF540F|nr:twin-arginine translocation signal domain-containing protein [Halorarius litoreus]
MSSRRTFLAGTASAAALLAGCTVGYDPAPEPTVSPAPPFALELVPLSARTVGEAYLLDWDTLSEFQRGVLTNVLERGEWMGIDYEPVVRPGSLVDHGGRVHRILVESTGERVVESALVTVEYDPDADWQAETLSRATPLAALSPVDRSSSNWRSRRSADDRSGGVAESTRHPRGGGLTPPRRADGVRRPRGRRLPGSRDGPRHADGPNLPVHTHTRTGVRDGF